MIVVRLTYSCDGCHAVEEKVFQGDVWSDPVIPELPGWKFVDLQRHGVVREYCMMCPGCLEVGVVDGWLILEAVDE